MNGPVDGLCDHTLDDEGAFMFTSESVGEGHPGKKPLWQMHSRKNTFIEIKVRRRMNLLLVLL